MPARNTTPVPTEPAQWQLVAPLLAPLPPTTRHCASGALTDAFLAETAPRENRAPRFPPPWRFELELIRKSRNNPKRIRNFAPARERGIILYPPSGPIDSPSQPLLRNHPPRSRRRPTRVPRIERNCKLGRLARLIPPLRVRMSKKMKGMRPHSMIFFSSIRGAPELISLLNVDRI